MHTHFPDHSDRPTAYILVGLPGSGKSTWVKQNERLLDYPVVISSDALIEDYAAENGLTYNEAFKTVNFPNVMAKMWENFDLAIAQQKSIIVDRTNLVKSSRAGFLGKLPGFYRRVAIVFEISSVELEQRLDYRAKTTGKAIPMTVIEKMIANYDEPTFEEFDEIVQN